MPALRPFPCARRRLRLQLLLLVMLLITAPIRSRYYSRPHHQWNLQQCNPEDLLIQAITKNYRGHLCRCPQA